MKRSDLSGQRFGRLTVIGLSAPRPHSGGTLRVWNCRCDCGAATVAETYALTHAKKLSCGCFNRDRASRLNRTHGLAKSVEWHTWIGMRKRCNNPKAINFPDYGGRGIKICERWESFENFLADMGQRPTGTSIERVNVDGNYEPSNCVWATRTQQSRNRRTNIYVIIDGERRCLSDWCEQLGRNYPKTLNRIYQLGWSPLEALEINHAKHS